MSFGVAGPKLDGASELLLGLCPFPVTSVNCRHSEMRVRKRVIELQCFENHRSGARNPISRRQRAPLPTFPNSNIWRSVIGVLLDGFLEIIYGRFRFFLQ